MSRLSNRGVGGIVKRATNFLSEVPGGETLVLQAVRDMLGELRDLRRENARLLKRIETLEDRLERERMKRGLPVRRAPAKKATATRKKSSTTRSTSAKRTTSRSAKAAPARRRTPSRRQKGLIESAVDAAERIL